MQSGSGYFTQREKEIAAQEAARQAAEAAKIVTVKQYGERVFMPGKLAGTIGKRHLLKIAAPIIRTHWIGTFTPSSANEKCRRSHVLSWKPYCWAN